MEKFKISIENGACPDNSGGFCCNPDKTNGELCRKKGCPVLAAGE